MSTSNQVTSNTVVHGRIALRDVTTTGEEIKDTGLGRKATPQDTPIFICELDDCSRLFPSRERLAIHRKRDHNTEDAYKAVLTWNTEQETPNQMQE
ncbi:hypothetical protein FRC19_007744 [Serendipita sp. 401]|nr:hypothetical protein FRC16_007975 [Serendipita sp. 398]KAG8805634.1 hypothetical protein FRC19_007744 [Serendipita sp. 401]KAG8838252.1 hypothetical protein FRC18_005456 [Serendipita sp. 400]